MLFNWRFSLYSIAWLAGWLKGIWIIGFAVIAWSLHLHESSNLWDFLLDPALAIWSLISLCKEILRQQKRKSTLRDLY
jgi:hypothetical protein